METTDELSLDFIDELLGKTKPIPSGPPTSTNVIWLEEAKKCTDCRNPTYIVVREKPRCTVHAIYELTRLLDERTAA
jgi:hypothetical protein